MPIQSNKYPLNPEEDLLVIHSDNKPLSPEDVDDLEGPIDEEEPLELPDVFKTVDVLKKQGLELLGDRESCSGGIFGPIFKLKVKDIESGEEFFLLERTFTDVKDIERRFCILETGGLPGKPDSEPSYEIINKTDNHKNKLVIDYLYNEEHALRDLQGIKGIPKFFGAVYDDFKGSILMEYIDGPDLSMVLMQNKSERPNLDILVTLEKVKSVYTAAAEKGFINNSPVGGTVMLDDKYDPYLADWYLYSQGRIDADGPVRDKYLQGLKDIEDLKKSLASL